MHNALVVQLLKQFFIMLFLHKLSILVAVGLVLFQTINILCDHITIVHIIIIV